MRPVKNSSGFTLIELSMVMFISVMLLLGFMRITSAYRDSLLQEKSTRVTENGQTVLARFYDMEGRYPCPARPLPPTDPNYGTEDCTIAPTPGARDTNNVNGLADDQVIVGIMPFYAYHRNDDGTIPDMDDKISLPGLVEKNEIIQTSLVDPWGNALSYAVTKSMTVKNTFDAYRGAIGVKDEWGRDTGGTKNNAHYIVVMHGRDKLGGFDAQSGTASAACDPAVTLEFENCNGNSTFVAALRSETDTTPATFYDDRTSYSATVPVPLWSKNQAAGVIQTKTEGNVGIGTPTPREKLEVGKWEKLVPSNPEYDAAAQVKDSSIKVEKATVAKEICDTNGKCFAPNSLIHLGCPAGRYLKGATIDNSGSTSVLKPDCQIISFQNNPDAKQNCDDAGFPGYMTGLFTDGKIVCGNP